MTETLPPPPAPTPEPAPASTGVLITCATIIILAALSAGGYLLWQELQRMASAKPAAPPEVTEALDELRSGLERQRSDNMTQLQTLQQEIAALKEQQAAQPPAPDIDATLAPVQEKLDAIAAQLQEVPPASVAEPVTPVAEAAPVDPVAAAPDALRDYLALRRTVESGEPYAAELAVLIPQLADTQQEAINTLQAYAEHGIAEEPVDQPVTQLAPWMESVNDRLQGLVSIKPTTAKKPVDDEARREVLVALDTIEASLLGQ